MPVATVCSQLKRKENLPLTGPLGIPVTTVVTLKNEEVDGNVMVVAPWQQVRILLRVQDLFCRHECMVAECIRKKIDGMAINASSVLMMDLLPSG